MIFGVRIDGMYDGCVSRRAGKRVRLFLRVSTFGVASCLQSAYHDVSRLSVQHCCCCCRRRLVTLVAADNRKNWTPITRPTVGSSPFPRVDDAAF
ncbi:hypothetical protein O3P69_008608 [Scylla paramamosain]|uniref:Uncharacterized protein n=1 Tax=Scylla paramamosain TaxID=85552 RepID=A0AAW0SLD3_SCYPA